MIQPNTSRYLIKFVREGKRKLRASESAFVARHVRQITRCDGLGLLLVGAYDLPSAIRILTLCETEPTHSYRDAASALRIEIGRRIPNRFDNDGAINLPNKRVKKIAASRLSGEDLIAAIRAGTI